MTIYKRVPQHFKYNTRYVADKQRGVVLVVSLIFLIALTAVASALMLNTTTDMKMSGASETQMVAKQEAFGAMDELVFSQVTKANGQDNNFISPIVLYQNNTKIDVLGGLASTNKENNITSANIAAANNQYNLEVGCPRAMNANSANLEVCNILQVQLNKRYGRNNTSAIQVNAGIIQKLRRNL